MKEPIELSTGLPMSWVVTLDDENPTIEVEWYFVRMVLQRLNKLKEISPDNLALNDYPEAERLARRLMNKIQ